MDLSQFQQNLKQQTQNIHTQVESHLLMQSFLKGTYTEEHLYEFLINLFPIYAVVENRLLSKEIEQNIELCKGRLILVDIDFLEQRIANSKNYVIKKCTEQWLDNAKNISAELLKAELYCRWLGDLYGGKILAQTVIPNNLYNTSDSFREISLVREILDKPITENDKPEQEIINRAIEFFNFHTTLFDAIYYGTP